MRPNAKYCCQQHKRNDLKTRVRGIAAKKASRRCARCKGPIAVSQSLSHKYCSRRCAKGTNPFYALIFQPRICPDCGIDFETLLPWRKFCADCGANRHRNQHSHKRRCRVQGVPYEVINRIAVFKRDNWTCQVCGHATPRELLGLGWDYSPELGHIVSLHWGPNISPGHVVSNVHLECHQCNANKNAEEGRIKFSKALG